jgi:hypothetical protein
MNDAAVKDMTGQELMETGLAISMEAHEGQLWRIRGGKAKNVMLQNT